MKEDDFTEEIKIDNSNECEHCSYGIRNNERWVCGKKSGNFRSRTWQSCEHFKGREFSIDYIVDKELNLKMHNEDEGRWNRAIRYRGRGNNNDIRTK